MKRIGLLLALIFPLIAFAQKGEKRNYMEGAVPEKNGAVVFEQKIETMGVNKTVAYDRLFKYAESLVASADVMPNARIIESEEASGIIALRMDENLYFKKTVLVSHFTRIFYNLTFTINDNHVDVVMTNISYVVDPDENGGGDNLVRAEKWITDAEAINHKKEKLTRIGGKFRVKTIDRFDEIVDGVTSAVLGEGVVK